MKNILINDFIKQCLSEAIEDRKNGFKGYTIEEVKKEIDAIILSKEKVEQL